MEVFATQGVSATRGCLLLGVSAPGGVSATWGVSAMGGVSATRGCLLLGGVCYPGGVCYQGVVCYWGCLLRGCIQHAMGQTPPHRGQTDTCENIAFTNFVCGW